MSSKNSSSTSNGHHDKNNNHHHHYENNNGHNKRSQKQQEQQQQPPPLVVVHPSSTSSSMSLNRRVGLAVLACLQNALVGGLIYGWPNIDRTLLGNNGNDDGGTTAELSLTQTTQIFSWASATSLASTLILGVVLDQYGPRICSVCGQLCIVLGILMFAWTEPGHFTGYAIAAQFISFGAPAIQLSIVHVANLFPQNQYLVLCGLNGCISLSVCVFAAFDWLYHNYPQYANIHTLFGSYVPVAVISLIASAIFWPDTPYEPPPVTHHHHHHHHNHHHNHNHQQQQNKQGGGGGEHEVLLDIIVNDTDTDTDDEDDEFWTPEEVFVEATVAHPHLVEQPLDSYLRSKSNPRFERSKSFILSDQAIHKNEPTLISLKDVPFWNQFTSATYTRSVIHFVTCCFLANFYVASFSTEVADYQTYTLVEQHQLAQLLALAMSSGVFVAFFVGWLMDRVGQVVCLLLTIVLGQFQLIVLVSLGNHKHWMITSFGLYVLFRQFLFPTFIASITDRLGFKYFGLISGIGFALSGVSQVLMAPLVVAVQGDCHRMTTFDTTEPAINCSSGYWTELHLGEIVLLAVLMLIPFFEHLDRTQRGKQVRRVLERHSSFGYGSLAPTMEEEEEEDDGDEDDGLFDGSQA